MSINHPNFGNMADDRVIIFDTTLRDGEQSPGFSMNLTEKLRMAEALAELGVDVIEAGFPIASPGDFESVYEIARTIKGPVIAGLARSAKGDILRAAEAVAPAERKRIEMIHHSAVRAASAGDAKVYSALNEDLHRSIYAGAHNTTLDEVARGLRQRLAPFRSMMFFTLDNRMQHSNAEHQGLVEAILAQDGDVAGRAMHDHAAHSAMNALSRLRADALQGAA